ncbi:unnamed protein product [Protopolystoma xenopodis]|uniref:Uncharacterized protein n=1 Tax=Protopolystoma xenopodis TaxID=117903 RepID=A0A3S5C9H9_9PLAT|nr:unnamed protein product [Protopolystoma xenopodis]
MWTEAIAERGLSLVLPTRPFCLVAAVSAISLSIATPPPPPRPSPSMHGSGHGLRERLEGLLWRRICQQPLSAESKIASGLVRSDRLGANFQTIWKTTDSAKRDSLKQLVGLLTIGLFLSITTSNNNNNN